MVQSLRRRELLKSFIGTAAWAGLSPLLNGCITTRETREEIENVNWDANPAIPIPIHGCYVGWHSDLVGSYLPFGRDYVIQHYKKYDAPYLKNFIGHHERKGGCIPAVFSFTTIHIGVDWFPNKICEFIQSEGVIPLIRFHYPDDHLSFAKRKFDDELKRFASEVVDFQQPIFFVPWPVVNYRRQPKGYLYRSGTVDPEAIIAAWERMHRIFKHEGANEHAVWGLHLLLDHKGKSIQRFKIDPSLFDWIGFSVYRMWNWVQRYSISYEIKIASEWARTNYPDKPVALFELGITDNNEQKIHIKSAYNTIKKLPRIKMVMYCQFWAAGFGCCSTLIGNKSIATYRNVLSDPYFIKGGIH